MRGADGRRRYTIPDDIHPERGQVAEYSSCVSVSKETCDVLHEREVGSNVAKDSRDVGPEVAGVVAGEPFPGDAEGWAREARSNAIHDATPGSSVEGAEVVPDREQGKHAVELSSQKHLATVRLDFDRRDGAVAEKLGAEDPSTSARA